MKKNIRSGEEIEADIRMVETYLNYIVKNNRVSGLYFEMKRDFDTYQDTKKDRLLRALVKEVRVMLRETFSKSELESYQSMLGVEQSSDDIELNAVLERGEILDDDEFQLVGASIDNALSEGGVVDIDVLNGLLLAYEKKKKGGRSQ